MRPSTGGTVRSRVVKKGKKNGGGNRSKLLSTHGLVHGVEKKRGKCPKGGQKLLLGDVVSKTGAR